MSLTKECYVSFICKEEEKLWASQFLTSNVSVPGADEFEVSEEIDVPVAEVSIKHYGHIITLSSGAYGLLNPAKMDLPKSLMAVVFSSYSVQGDPEDPIYGVLTKNIRTHDFSDTSIVVEDTYFDLDNRIGDPYDEEPKYLEGIEDIDGAVERLRDAYRRQRDECHKTLTMLLYQRLMAQSQNDKSVAPLKGNQHLYDPETEIELNNTEIITLNREEFPPLNAWLDPDIEEPGYVKPYAFCEPTAIGLTREEYLAAMKTAAAGGDDVTGCWRAIQHIEEKQVRTRGNQGVGLPDSEREIFWNYLLTRVESETSPSGRSLLRARSGDDVYSNIFRLLNSGRWMNFKIETETATAFTDNKITNEPEPIPEEELDETFEAALGEAFFERIFKDAEIYKSRILENIDGIAGDFCEGNEFQSTGNEPDWLLQALRKAGALFEGEKPEPTSQDNAGYPGRAAILQQLFQPEEFSNNQKLLTENERSVLADLIDIAICGVTRRGVGTLVVNLVNNSTTYMSGSDVEGDITVAKEEQDEEVLLFLRNILEEIDNNDWSTKVLITLIANGGTKTFALDKEKPVQPSNANESSNDLLEKVQGQFNEGTETFFRDKTVCITGSFHTSRTEIQKWLEGLGASVTGSVSKNTDLLITGNKPGSKLEKAKELSVPLLSAETLKQAMKGWCNPTSGAFTYDPKAGDLNFTWDGWCQLVSDGRTFEVGGEYWVYILVPKFYWEVNIKGKLNHKLVAEEPMNKETGVVYWKPDFDTCGTLDDDLVVEILGEDGPDNIYDMDDHQRQLFFKAVIDRGAFTYVQNMELTDEVRDEEGDQISDDVYAELLGLDPNQIEVSMQG